MPKFQIIIMVLFGAAAIVAALIFGGVLPGFKGTGSRVKGPAITVWGIFDRIQMKPLVQELNDENENLFKINYTEINPLTYESDLVNALAAGRGPDVWVITQDAVLKNKERIFVIPFESFSERDFRNTFFNSSELFLVHARPREIESQDGIVGLPIAVDPLVLYWNRDLFSTAGIARSPQYWDEFINDSEILSRSDKAGNIIQSGAALGEFRNVKNAKDILSMLILQTGNKVVDPVSLRVVFSQRGNLPLNPAENAVRFFNEFSNPRKSSYSWNRALPSSDDMFAAGSLAMYFGYASELPDIENKNPHLNFDVAPVPQIRPASPSQGGDGAIKATFGKIYSAVVSNASINKQAALSAISKIFGRDFNGRFTETFSMAPAHRDLLAKGSKDLIFSVFYKSAIMTRAWLEPDPNEIYKIFKNMVESSATGKVRVSAAVKEAEKQIEQLLK